MDQTVEALKQQIAELEARMPQHSVPPAMMLELEALEEALARRIAQEAVEQS